jgi:hypothetical protein
MSKLDHSRHFARATLISYLPLMNGHSQRRSTCLKRAPIVLQNSR